MSDRDDKYMSGEDGNIRTGRKLVLYTDSLDDLLKFQRAAKLGIIDNLWFVEHIDWTDHQGSVWAIIVIRTVVEFPV